MNAQQRRQADRSTAAQQRRVRAGAPGEATQVPLQMHRVDASQLAANDVFLSEPPEFKSTPESRKVRASFWLRVVLPIAIVTACFWAALVIVFFK